jgi:cell division protein FtsZ
VSKRRASMREGPLADLFRQTDGSQENVAETAAESAAAAAAAAVPAPAPEPQPEPVLEEPTPEPVAAEPDPPQRSDRGAAPQPDESEPSEPPRLRAVPDPSDAPEMPALPQALRARGEASAYLASIRVVGVGGGGLNALQRMIDADLHGVEFVAINTDAQQLAMSDAGVKLQIGRDLTSGLGSGSDPDLGRKAAEDSIDRLRQVLRGSDLVFVTAGEGGGTGTGAAPVIARAARELGSLTVGIVTMPFGFEGRRRGDAAQAGLEALQEAVDTLIVVPNDRLLEVLDQQTSMVEAFQVADDVLRQGVQGISDLVTLPAVINLDFADVRTIMSEAGRALLGIGMGHGNERAILAAEKAISSPLLETSMEGARAILLSITGGADLSLVEVSEAAKLVGEAAHPDANIIFGANVDEELNDQVWVTVVATRFDGRPAPQRRVAEPTIRRTKDAPRSARRERGSDLGGIDVPEFLPG